jgi:hypothetical protein
VTDICTDPNALGRSKERDKFGMMARGPVEGSGKRVDKAKNSQDVI